jgi:hypothetical protein
LAVDFMADVPELWSLGGLNVTIHQYKPKNEKAQHERQNEAIHCPMHH